MWLWFDLLVPFIEFGFALSWLLPADFVRVGFMVLIILLVFPVFRI